MADLTLPTGAVYGSRVETAGDLTVGNITLSHSYRVSAKTGEQLRSSDSVFVSNEEATRISSQVDAENTTGSLAIGVRQGDNVSGILATTPTLTTLGTKVNVDEKGLSFDSDNSCIFFGGEKTFRIKYELSTPPRLLFQYRSSSGDYVTKFSVLKE